LVCLIIVGRCIFHHAVDGCLPGVTSLLITNTCSNFILNFLLLLVKIRWLVSFNFTHQSR
jgi:hypothetical protein